MLKDISHPYSCFRHLRLASLKLFRLGFDVKTLVDSSQEGNLYFLKNYFVILWKIIVILLFFSFKTCAAIDFVAPNSIKCLELPLSAISTISLSHRRTPFDNGKKMVLMLMAKLHTRATAESIGVYERKGLLFNVNFLGCLKSLWRISRISVLINFPLLFLLSSSKRVERVAHVFDCERLYVYPFPGSKWLHEAAVKKVKFRWAS